MASSERQIVEDVGAGKGHLSTVQLVHDEQFGRNVILKIPGGEMSKKVLSIQDCRFENLHNTEVNVYRILQDHPKDILFPKIFAMQHMELTADPVKNGFIVMEYVDKITHLYPEDTLKPHFLIEPLKNLARLHSLGSELTEVEKSTVPREFLSGWFSELFSEKNVNLFIRHWKDGPLIEWMTSPESKEAIELLTKVLKPEVFQKLNDDCKISGVQEVLCHGDYQSANLLFQKLPCGAWNFRGVCDFQGANWGNAAQDLTRLFVTALSGKDRRESGESLLKVYYDELVRVTMGNVPFTWQQLTRSYTRFLPHHAAVVCITTPGYFLRKLATKEEGKEKNEFEKIIKEKYVTLMEDLTLAWKESWSD